MLIDTHAHIFHTGLMVTEHARYIPHYDATRDDFQVFQTNSEIDRSVLIQPSFLGTDNSYLLQALQARPDSLRGIVVVDPSCTTAELVELDRSGVVGVRLNLVKKELPALSSELWDRHLSRIAALEWQVEIQCEPSRILQILPTLLDYEMPVVIDHFGLPEGPHDVRTPDSPWRRLIDSVTRVNNLYFKLSAPYRVPVDTQVIDREVVPRLKDSVGPGRLLFGTDWPHTQFEDQTKPDPSRQFRTWYTDQLERDASTSAASALFKFSMM